VFRFSLGCEALDERSLDPAHTRSRAGRKHSIDRGLSAVPAVVDSGLASSCAQCARPRGLAAASVLVLGRRRATA
jgi:hypothetical protein